MKFNNPNKNRKNNNIIKPFNNKLHVSNMWFVERLGKKEFDYVHFDDKDIDMDNDRKAYDKEHKYTEVIHSPVNFYLINMLIF